MAESTGKMETHVVQIVDKPDDLFVSEIWDTLFVLLLVEETGKLIGELERRLVELFKLLKNFGLCHGGQSKGRWTACGL